MHNGMFSEQDDLPRRTNKPLPILLRALRNAQTRIIIERQFLNSTTDSMAFVLYASTNLSLMLICTSGECDSACFEKSALQIIEEICGVFDAYTQTDKVFWQSSSCADGRVDGGVRHDARHADE